MSSTTSFHYLVRGVIRDGPFILLAHLKGAENTFLPGGHIELGESAQAALVRELHEELSVASQVGHFLGAIEHSWPSPGRTANATNDNFELNLVFEVEADSLKANTPPVIGGQAEAGLEFLWAHHQDLANHNLQPAPLVGWLSTPNPQSTPGWASTLPDEPR